MNPSRSKQRLYAAVGLALLGGWAGVSGFVGLVLNFEDEMMASELAQRLPRLLRPLTVLPVWAQPVCGFGIVVGCVAGVLVLRRLEDAEKAAAHAPMGMENASQTP